MRKKFIIFMGSVVVLFVLAIIGYLYYDNCLNPRRGMVSDMEETLELDEVLNRDKAIADMEYLMYILEEFHPAWTKDGDAQMVSRVNAKYQEEIEAFGEKVTVLELWQAASRVIYEMNDAHTRASVNRMDGELSYELDGEWTHINGIKKEEIYNDFLKLWPYELEAYAETRFEKYIIYKEYMELVGIDTSNGIDVIFADENGTKEIHLEAAIREIEGNPFIECKYDTENDVAIFTMNTCKDNDEYKQKLKEFFEGVKENSISNVVFDFRANNGGSITAAKTLMRYINVDTYKYCNNLWTRMGDFWYKEQEVIKNSKADEVFSGNVYVLTSAKTFSSAMDMAMIIRDNNLGTIVGEACGNMPDSYTLNIKYQMPNSKLKLVVSGGKQNRIDESKINEVFLPDIEVSAEDALEKVYELIK